MALVACPECTKQISTLAAACPHCGYPMQAKAATQNSATAPQLRNCPDCGGSGSQRKDCFCCGGTGIELCGCHEGRGWTGYEFIVCQLCHGNYRSPCSCCAARGYDIVKCSTCEGSGQLTFAQFDVLHQKRAEDERGQAEDARRQAEEQAKQKAQAEAKEATFKHEVDKRRAEEHAKWLADAPRREAEEAKRRAEREAQRLAEEQAKRRAQAEVEEAKQREAEAKQKAREEAERPAVQKARAWLFCCTNCGMKFDFVDRIIGRKNHAGCLTYKPRTAGEDASMAYCRKCRCRREYETCTLFGGRSGYKCAVCRMELGG